MNTMDGYPTRILQANSVFTNTVKRVFIMSPPGYVLNPMVRKKFHSWLLIDLEVDSCYNFAEIIFFNSENQWNEKFTKHVTILAQDRLLMFVFLTTVEILYFLWIFNA